MQNLMNDLTKIFAKDDRIFADGKLLKNKLTELALKLDQPLIELLLSDKRAKENFFIEQTVKKDTVLVFDKDKFISFVNNKEFLPDSFTSFKNKIGLMTNGDYLKEKSDVVLAWAYKDCVLEGGQDKEDQKRDEILYNETLAPDEIDRLFEPKVLTNFKQYDVKGEHKVTDFTADDNLIIKGNNLLALHCLKKKYRGKVKLIYIDPPYNPDSKANTFCYNNKFNESTWLTFMKNRLEIAKSLLCGDGAMIIAIDENEHLEMGMLAKEIFKDYEIHCVTIVHNPRGVQGSNFSYTHEYAFFIIPKNTKILCDRIIDEKEIDWSNLRNWGGESERSDAKNCFYPVLVDPSNDSIIGFGNVCKDNYHPTSSNVKDKKLIKVFPIDKEGVERKWRYARQSVDDVKQLLRAKKTKRGYEIEIGKDFGTYKTVWIDPKYDANEYGTKIVKSLVPGCKFDFPKSLYNVFDCVHSIVGNDKNAIVLDFFAGSGTTAHAVLDLNKQDNGNRKFILCEQMGYVDDVTVKRVNKVIQNNKRGSFIFAELMEWNEKYIQDIKDADTSRKLLNIYEKMKQEAFFRYDIELSKFDEKEFAQLPLKEQKQVLCECLDKNHLYVNLSEIDDATYKVRADDKKLNKEFYKQSI
jgi:adenine-specific DNA-methyltransferase